VDLSAYGETVRVPLGTIVLGRSGDKGNFCVHLLLSARYTDLPKASDWNVGFFVRPSPNNEVWDWLRTILTVDKIKDLLGSNEVHKFGKPELRIDRFEMPGIRAVHFLQHDHLDRGYNSCSTYDTLGTNCCECLRAKTIEIPNKFLEYARI